MSGPYFLHVLDDDDISPMQLTDCGDDKHKPDLKSLEYTKIVSQR